jgi:hypothetical protein
MPSRPINANKGQGFVKLDNTQGAQDVFAKLCSNSIGPKNKVKGHACSVNRQIHLRKGETFQLESVSTGGYEVQFIEIQSGKAMITPYFDVPHGKPSMHEFKLFPSPGQQANRQIPSTDF